MTNRTKSEFTSHCRIAAKTNFLMLLLFSARSAHARYSSRMIDRFLNWGDHGEPKSGKIKGRCQPPPVLDKRTLFPPGLWWVISGPCGFRPFDFDSKLKIENQKFKIVIFNVWFLKNWKSQIYNLNCQLLFLRNIKLKSNFQCFENRKLKIENGQSVVFISCF